MFPPDQMRTWAADLQACAARCEKPDHMEECLLLATRFTELAGTTEAFMRALDKAGVVGPWQASSRGT
jgi:hypothetical protein